MQPTRPMQKTNSPNEASGEKYDGKVEKEFTSFCCKIAAEAGTCQTSMRRILKEDLRTYPYKMQKGMNFQPLMNVYET